MVPVNCHNFLLVIPVYLLVSCSGLLVTDSPTILGSRPKRMGEKKKYRKLRNYLFVKYRQYCNRISHILSINHTVT